MSQERVVYIHLVPHQSYRFDDLGWYKDPVYEHLLGNVPKAELLILESAPRSARRLELVAYKKLRKDFLDGTYNDPLLSFEFRYFVKSRAKDVVFESVLYDNDGYEKVRKFSLEMEKAGELFNYFLNRGELSRAKDAFVSQSSLLNRGIALRDSLLPPLIEDVCDKRGVKSALILIGSRHKSIARYFDKSGANTLLLLSDSWAAERAKAGNHRKDFLGSVVRHLIDASALGARELSYDVVGAFDENELRAIEGELGERLGAASKFGGVSEFEVNWHVDEIIRPRLSERGLAKLIPKWKFL